MRRRRNSTVLHVLVLALAGAFLIMGAVTLEATSNNTASTPWENALTAKVEVADEPSAQWKSWFLPHCEQTIITVQDYSTEAEYEACIISSINAQFAVYTNNGVSRYAARKYGDAVFHRISSRAPATTAFVATPDGPLLTWQLSGLDAFTLQSFANPLLHAGYLSAPGLGDDRIGFYTGFAGGETFAGTSGNTLKISAVAISRNGKYAVAQLQGGGIVRVDLTTRSLKLVARDAQIQSASILAISDTGERVAVINSQTGTARIYTELDECGAGDITSALERRSERCYYIDFTDQIADQLTSGTMYNPEFLNDQSSFVVHIWNGSSQKSHKITVTPDPDDYRLDYLAMGDSYSSGEGDAEKSKYGYSYYLSGTDTSIDNCHISSRSYPFRLRQEWQITNEKMRSVACSGARILPDYNGNPTNYYGQGGRLSDHVNADDIRQFALRDFTPGYIPQLEFVGKYKPKLVTLTGGGNDIGFANILEYCATPHVEDLIVWVNSDCGYAVKGSELEKTLYASIDSQYLHTKKLVDDIKLASPLTKIVIVGYPSFIAHVSALPCVLNSGALTISEIKMMNNMVDYMNDMLQRVAHDTDATYVNITSALEGGRICEGSKYVTGVWRKTTGEATREEQFHPNALGHWQIAQVIKAANIYKSEDVVPTPGTYDTSKSYTNTLQTPLMKEDYATKGGLLHIEVSPGLLNPNSPYAPTINSSPQKLGNFLTNSDGSIDIALPLDTISPGRHVLTIDGIGSDGEPIRLYQYMEVRASSTDADGDGILDVFDNCQYITEWYDETTGKNICAPDVKAATKEDKLDTSIANPPQLRSDESTQASYALASVLNGNDPTPYSALLTPHTSKTENHQYDLNKKTLNYGMIVILTIIIFGISGGVMYAYSQSKKR